MAYTFNPAKYKKQLVDIFSTLAENIPKSPSQDVSPKLLQRTLHKHNKAKGVLFSKYELLAGLDWLIEENIVQLKPHQEQKIRKALRMKPMRTRSGVAVVTVLTKPYPCPGKCIFCPNDVRMPKSYLRDEPGAQRAERNAFDPYLQVYNRLLAMQNIGHPVSKVELIILGGTWSFYPESYQIWFIKRCFDAMNDFGVRDNRAQVAAENIFEDAQQKYSAISKDGKRKTYNQLIAEIRAAENDFAASKNNKQSATWQELETAQQLNEQAGSRCVGLVVETRPDSINAEEVIRIRKLGCTKVQLGVQTLDDEVNEANARGHDADQTAHAFQLLRTAGFKIHVHMMPALYTATPESDLQSYLRLFDDDRFKPDEVKIYPTSVIANTELDDLWKEGAYKPYSQEQLIDLLVEMITNTPPYCRLTRIIRDIPTPDIQAGNKKTNLRQLVEDKIRKLGKTSQDIRWREIRGRQVMMDDLRLDEYRYETMSTTELFLSFVTKDTNQIAGFLRLSLPKNSKNDIFAELNGTAMIREIHVYGQLVDIGDKEDGKAQHLGLGTKLISRAKQIVQEEGYQQLAVISAVGTREYYHKKGFQTGGLYQVLPINS